jgi:hypothetical protein
MFQHKRIHAGVFRHALDGQMEWRMRIYAKLTIPLLNTNPNGSPKDVYDLPLFKLRLLLPIKFLPQRA